MKPNTYLALPDLTRILLHNMAKTECRKIHLIVNDAILDYEKRIHDKSEKVRTDRLAATRRVLQERRPEWGTVPRRKKTGTAPKLNWGQLEPGVRESYFFVPFDNSDPRRTAILVNARIRSGINSYRKMHGTNRIYRTERVVRDGVSGFEVWREE